MADIYHSPGTGKKAGPTGYPDGMPEHLHTDIESTIHQHMGHDGQSDEALDWVTGLMSALEPLIVRALDDALGAQTTDEVLWEGETIYVRTQPGYPDDPGMSAMPFGRWFDCPPGTRVRVVRATDPEPSGSLTEGSTYEEQRAAQAGAMPYPPPKPCDECEDGRPCPAHTITVVRVTDQPTAVGIIRQERDAWATDQPSEGDWLHIRCSFCGHWERGQFTKEQVASWLRTHRNAMVGPNEGHTVTASTCPHPCGTPVADQPSEDQPPIRLDLEPETEPSSVVICQSHGQASPFYVCLREATATWRTPAGRTLSLCDEHGEYAAAEGWTADQPTEENP